MPFEYELDRYGTYRGLSISPENFIKADVIIQGVPFECGTSGKKGTSYAMEYLRQICRDLQLISRRGVPITDLKICDVGNVPVFPLDSEATRKSIEDSMKFLLSKTSAPIITI